MQGLFVAGTRPASKAAVKRQLAEDATAVYLEATSMFGNEYDGRVTDAPDGEYYVVGPDPHTSRKFYGIITVTAGKVAIK